MRRLLVKTESIAPGAVSEQLVPHEPAARVEIYFDPPSAAHFTVERKDTMTPGEVLAATAGQHCSPAVYLRIRNTSGEARQCRFNVDLWPDLSELEHRIGVLMEDKYRQGGDPITVDELAKAEPRAFDATRRAS